MPRSFVYVEIGEEERCVGYSEALEGSYGQETWQDVRRGTQGKDE